MRILDTVPRASRRSRSDIVTTSSRGARRGFQIGPRIRIGGSIGKLGTAVQKITPDFRTLVGGALSPAIGLGTSIANGTVGSDLKKGAINAGVILGGQKLLSGSTPAGGSDAAGGSSIWDKAKGVFSGGGSDGQGNFGTLGDLAGKGQNLLGQGGGTGMDKALLVALIADAAAKTKRQRELENQGLAYATDAYDAKKPLRQQGLSMMQSQQTPDLSFLDNTANPYTKTVTPFNVSAKTPVLPTKGTY